MTPTPTSESPAPTPTGESPTTDRQTSDAPAVPPGPPSARFLGLVDRGFARRHLVLSVGTAPGGAERLWVAERTAPWIASNVAARLGAPVEAAPVPGELVADAVDHAYDAERAGARADDEAAIAIEGAGDVDAELGAALARADADLLTVHDKGPVVRLVDLLLFDAVRRAASDLHVQPLSDRTLVRVRVDGALRTARELPAALATAVVSRVKVMARLDVAERRAPQDGRATVTIGDGPAARRIDLRISTMPCTYGERVVVRLLDPTRSAELLSCRALGMPPAVERAFLAQVSLPHGIVLVTGPTGSGKTTTLYAALAWITMRRGAGGAGGSDLNIMTLEDPVEYDLSTARLAVSQTQLSAKKGVTFATGLRHVLRQDPDVVMVGEIRDEETARIAVQASLTGHMVLSTLHTNDSTSAVTRLLDLGVEPFLVASSLRAALAQRLVRRLHRPCAGAGCDACLGTGYRGRTGVFELYAVGDAARALIGSRATAAALHEDAVRAGMVTLAQAAERLVEDGTTTRAEAARVLHGVEGVEA